MGLLRTIRIAVRKRMHRREIAAALRNYSDKTGQQPDRVERFSDSGTFRQQLDRLFETGNAAETEELREIAESVVGASITNRYYKPADFLSDVVAELRRHTFLGFGDLGEAPLRDCEDQVRRDTKLRHVIEAWLSPVKVAAIESVVADYAHRQGKTLPYRDLQRFERASARVFSILDTSEVFYVQKILSQALLSETFDQAPVTMLLRLVGTLQGDPIPDGCANLRTRRPGQGFRLSTLIPQDRQFLLRTALAEWIAYSDENAE